MRAKSVSGNKYYVNQQRELGVAEGELHSSRKPGKRATTSRKISATHATLSESDSTPLVCLSDSELDSFFDSLIGEEPAC